MKKILTGATSAAERPGLTGQQKHNCLGGAVCFVAQISKLHDNRYSFKHFYPNYFNITLLVSGLNYFSVASTHLVRPSVCVYLFCVINHYYLYLVTHLSALNSLLWTSEAEQH